MKTDAFATAVPKFLQALLQQPDGKLVAAGTVRFDNQYDPALVRYTAGGRIDLAFGSAGSVQIPASAGYDETAALVRQDDGKLIVVAKKWTGSDYDFLLSRVDPKGMLDTDFGSAGSVVTAITPQSDTPRAALVERDVVEGRLVPTGRVVVVGSSAGSFAVARYEADLCGNGTLDLGENVR